MNLHDAVPPRFTRWELPPDQHDSMCEFGEQFTGNENFQCHQLAILSIRDSNIDPSIADTYHDAPPGWCATHVCAEHFDAAWKATVR